MHALCCRKSSETESERIQSDIVSAAPLTLKDSVSLHEPDLRQSQQDDEAIGPIYQSLRIGTRPNLSDLKGKGRECVELAQHWDQLVLKDDILYRQFEDTTCVCILKC